MSGYIGNIPTPQATQSRQSFTATASQTTFATVGYTAGFIDVYLNGVHLLDGTDYTATNGSDIVLTTGAALDDVVEFVAYETFSVLDQSFTGTTTTEALTTTGAFTSLGIDDNAAATAMTLDTSGNLLVGTTTPFAGGVTLSPLGVVQAERNNVSGAFNRTSTDGDILQFRKEGLPVGSIGVKNGHAYFGNGNSALYTASGTPPIIAPYNATVQQLSVDATDLGASNARFKDLYLSGGVVFNVAGGTGTSTSGTLDDYEEGTWTPTVTSTSGTITTVDNIQGYYTKIGRNVTLWASAKTTDNGTGAGQLSFGGLPFAPANTTLAAVGYVGAGYNSSSGLMLRATVTGAGNAILVTTYNYVYPTATGRSSAVSVTYYTS